MNYTEKYHLPQWEKTDRILMEDFNQMCADMEAGLSANAADTARVEEKANEIWHAMGYYIGTARDIPIVTGFRPRFILISRHNYEGNDSSLTYEPIFLFADKPESKSIRLTDESFIILKPIYEFPSINVWGREYFYIAFR